MKIIVFGLGNFGSHLGASLMSNGHEVIGVDISMNKVEKYQDMMTATMCLDSTQESAILELPLGDIDLIVIAIGEDMGASISTTALIKKNFKKRIIARSINEIHREIIEAMNITEIIEPEAESADELANRLDLEGALKCMNLLDEYEIIEVNTPKSLIGVNIKELDAKKTHDIYIVTTIQTEKKENFFGNITTAHKVTGILKPDYNINEGDILLIFGKSKNIKRFFEKFL